MMTNSTENVDNKYVLTDIIPIRENNERPDTKAIEKYINKNFATDVEEKPIEGIAMELLDHNIIENRHTTKGNSYLIRKRTPIDVISVKTTPQVNECELLSDTDQQFNDIALKSQNTSVIRRTQNMLSHTQDTQIDTTIQKTSLNNLKLLIL